MKYIIIILLITVPSIALAEDLSAYQQSQEILVELKGSSEKIKMFLDDCDNIAWKELPFGDKLVLPELPDIEDDFDEQKAKRITAILQLNLTKALTNARFYEEAYETLITIDPNDVLDMHSLLFHRAVIAHMLIKDEESANFVKAFMELYKKDSNCPKRFYEILKLLNDQQKSDKDSQDGESKTAQQIKKLARKMDNLRNKLDKKNLDKSKEEGEEIVKDLDDIIEDLEKKQKDAEQQAQDDNSEGDESKKAAKDSRLAKNKSPGTVDDKDIGSSDGWGDLPPKEREEALLRLEKEFPAHYRDIIESYFREMASQKD